MVLFKRKSEKINGRNSVNNLKPAARNLTTNYVAPVVSRGGLTPVMSSGPPVFNEHNLKGG